jgi:hypothetical protein
MPGYCLITRTRVAQFVGDFASRDACIAALDLPKDGVLERDPLHDNEPRLWLEEAPDALPRDGERHPL